MRTLRILSALIGVLWVCPAASAQQLPLADGVRLRVSTDLSGPKTGVLKGLTEDELTVALDKSGELVRVPVAEIRWLEVSRSRRGMGREGAILGVLGGAAAGALWAAVGHPSTPHTDSFSAEVIGFSAAFACGGLLVGAVFGSQVMTDRWEDVPLRSSPRSRPQPAPGVHLTLRF